MKGRAGFLPSPPFITRQAVIDMKIIKIMRIIGLWLLLILIYGFGLRYHVDGLYRGLLDILVVVLMSLTVLVVFLKINRQA